MQRKAQQQRIIKRSAFGIAGVLILALLGAILFSLPAQLQPQPPLITHFQLVNAGLVVTGSTSDVSFDYQPGNMSGYIEVQYSYNGKVIDTQILDTKDMTAGSQTASSSAMSDVATGDATVSLFWCPNYDCKQAKQVGFIDFTVYSWSS